jgi:hypothetical protein
MELLPFVNQQNKLKSQRQFKNIVDLVKTIVLENIIAVNAQNLNDQLMKE